MPCGQVLETAPEVTVTGALADGDVPPAPVQVTEYVVFVVGETLVDPLVPEAVKPTPVHDVALVLDHVRVEDCPEVIDVGEAVSAAVGAAGEATEKFTLALFEVFPAVSWHFA